MKNIYAVIMAGGKGTRLWPKSKRNCPKYSLCFSSPSCRTGRNFSLLQETLLRVRRLIPSNNIILVTTKKQEHLIKKQLPYLKKNNFLIEPEGKNTLPCIMLAATVIKKRILSREKKRDAVMVVLPADHLVKPLSDFMTVIEKAVSFAQRKKALLTIGMVPRYPATGYGYIQIGAGRKAQGAGYVKVFKVKKFIEKPPLEKARNFFRRKNFFWNSGIFVFSVLKILEEAKRFTPRIYNEFIRLEDIGISKYQSTLKGIYKNIPASSIDSSILEKSSSLFMIKGDFSWADMGSWESLLEVFAKDKNNNLSKGENVLHRVKDSIIINEQKNHLICAIGLDGITVVHTPEATLIQKKTSSHQLKKVVACLEKDNYFKKYA